MATPKRERTYRGRAIEPMGMFSVYVPLRVMMRAQEAAAACGLSRNRWVGETLSTAADAVLGVEQEAVGTGR